MNNEVQNQNQWCFAWYAKQDASTAGRRAALLKETKWTPGDTITVSFLDGDKSVQERVKNAAMAWVAPGMANLNLVFQDNTNSLIRISFRYRGSWSVLGTTCKQITDLTQPTMNFGWLTPASTDDEVNRVVLHEFGHALGLIHEHQNPNQPIRWNRDAVIRDLSGPPNNWPPETIERNMFEQYHHNQLEATALDGTSIMMYPIPASWTEDGFSADLNKTLSPIDKKFIRAAYPQD
jgi:serralysin